MADTTPKELSWAEVVGVAAEAERMWSAASKIRRSAIKARDAEEYMKWAHQEKAKLEASMAEIKAKLAKMNEDYAVRKTDIDVSMAAMETMVRDNQATCDQLVRDATNKAHAAIHDLDQSKKAAEKDLAHRVEVLSQEAQAHVAPVKARLEQETAVAEQRLTDIKNQVAAKEREKAEIQSMMTKMTAQMQQLVGAS